MQPTTIEYEWDCETIDAETGDIVDHSHGATLAQVRQWARSNPPADGTHYAIVLVRDYYNDRSWAYLDAQDRLPPHFTDAAGCSVAKVPARFHKETNR